MDAIAAELQQVKGIGVTESLVRQLAAEGLACIRYHVKRGNLRAAIWTVTNCMGAPTMPFAGRVEAMGPAELRHHFRALCKQLSLPEPVIQLMLLKFREQDEKATQVAPALPPPTGMPSADEGQWGGDVSVHALDPEMDSDPDETADWLGETAEDVDAEGAEECLADGVCPDPGSLDGQVSHGDGYPETEGDEGEIDWKQDFSDD